MNDSLDINLNETKRTENKKRILFADDNKLFRDTIKHLLENTKLFSVRTAQDGKEAINLLKKQDFDLLVTDYEMPKMDGYELFKKCKTVNSRLPVIFMTGSKFNEGMIEKAKTQGLVSCIYKPFNIEDIIKMIDVAFSSTSQLK
jgi:CheY-like chemotaxis protein